MSLFPESVRPTEVVFQEAVPELERIIGLPKREPVNCQRDRLTQMYLPEVQALVEYMTAKFARPPRACNCAEQGFPCITTLNPIQAWALREASRADGVLGLCGVGSGKTILGIMTPMAFPDCKLAVILAEPSQRLHYRSFYLRLREHFRVPSMIFDDSTGYMVDGVPSLHFRPYSLLSQAKSTDMLDHLSPDLIIADECHRIARRENSNTRRVLRYLAKPHARAPRVCAWSGTLVKKSVKDIAHLAAHALGMNSPYPLDPNEVEAWSGVLDPSPNPDRHSAVAKKLRKTFGPKTETERAFFVEGYTEDSAVREGHRERVITTLGVITTTGSSAAAANYLHERKVANIPESVKQALTSVRNEGVRPDGEELVEAMEIAQCARQVGAGFHYYWFYPEYAAAKSDQEREVVAIKIEAWFKARKAYYKELRIKLMHPEIHLDSPLLCANAAERAWRDPPYEGDLPLWEAETWPAWIEIKDKLQHESRTKWLDDYLARDAAAWGKEHRGIIWYQNNAFGKKVAELLGVPCHGGGPDAEKNIMAETGARSIVASIKAHGSGRDGLQRKFSEQLIAEVPSSNAIFEQLLGRLCRDGQKDDAIHTWVNLHVSENSDALRSALREAEFVFQSTGNMQLLLTCDKDFRL